MPQVKTSFSAAGDGSFTDGIATRFGMQAVGDFYLWAALNGMAYQVRAGTVTTPLVGTVAISATAAEMSADCLAGTTIIPVFFQTSLRLMPTLALELAVKSVGVVSSAGTAFVPLPLKIGGPASTSTARVQASGNVTVTSETALITRRHWSYSNPTGNTTAGTNLGIFAFPPLEWSPRVPPPLVGPACLYVQIAAATTGPSYYANFDFIEAVTANLI